MLNPIRNTNPMRSIDRSLNPIPNVERSPGPGGPSHAVNFDPAKHRPHNYPVKRLAPSAAVVRVKLPKMQDGGGVDEPDSMDEPMPDAMDLREPDDQLSPRDQQMKEIVVEAMAALRGQHPDPEKALKRFVDAFGEDELEELKQMMSHAEPDEDDTGGAPDQDEDDMGAAPGGAPPGGAPGGMQVGGLLHGPGSGQDDQIEAQTPGGRKVLLSDGEYVIDAPTVAILGDGSTNAGARRLDAFRKEARRQAYGHEDQAKAMKGGGRAALLEALNR